MSKELEINYEAIIDLHRLQNLDAMARAVERGSFNHQQAELAHEAFMRSSVLQTMVAVDVAMLEALLCGRVH